mgnify:CR=1 FL=1|tara:strand:- start:6123 stop:6860 length:738 start_codon:yes stop_codon:yes gene_type:complete
MGYLDHSTNNIIVDAVLTKKGREYLAQNNGDFNITHFSLGDDEVDYSIIKQYGRTVGKEKIEKNTPVLEAVTTADSALRYRLLTINESILYYPQINVSSNNLTADVLSLRTTTNTDTSTYNTQEEVIFKIKTSDSRRTAASFVNNVYRVEIDSNLLAITSNATAEKTDNFDKRTTYTVISRAVGTNNESELSFTLSVKSGISTSTTEFNKYKTANQTFVRTFVRMTSNQTGLTKIFEVKIYGPSS